MTAGVVVMGSLSDDPREMTVKEFAAYNRVTERTVYEWIKKGAVEHRRTPGGGIRILERRTRPRGPLQSSEDP